jgi:hypothetical protein
MAGRSFGVQCFCGKPELVQSGVNGRRSFSLTANNEIRGFFANFPERLRG